MKTLITSLQTRNDRRLIKKHNKKVGKMSNIGDGFIGIFEVVTLLLTTKGGWILLISLFVYYALTSYSILCSLYPAIVHILAISCSFAIGRPFLFASLSYPLPTLIVIITAPCVVLACYRLYKHLAPDNIPEHRHYQRILIYQWLTTSCSTELGLILAAIK